MAGVFAHASLWFALIIGPLVLWLLARNARTVRVHAAEAFNFQATFVAVLALASQADRLGSPVAEVVGAVGFVIALVGFFLPIAGIISASSGTLYRYPVRLRLLRDQAPSRSSRRRGRRHFDADGNPVEIDQRRET